MTMQPKKQYYMAFPVSTDNGIRSKFLPAISATKVAAAVDVFVSRSMDQDGNIMKVKHHAWSITDARSGAQACDGPTKAAVIDWFTTFVLPKVGVDQFERKSKDMAAMYGAAPHYERGAA